MLQEQRHHSSVSIVRHSCGLSLDPSVEVLYGQHRESEFVEVLGCMGSLEKWVSASGCGILPVLRATGFTLAI